MKKILLISIIILISGCSHKMENNFNFNCPESPNCVSSMAQDETHKILPLKYSGDSQAALEKLEQIIKTMKRTDIFKKDDKRIHAVFTSLIFRFKDDVYFEADDSEKIIHIKSASRTGYSDFGVNRKRVEKIRELFNK